MHYLTAHVKLIQSTIYIIIPLAFVFFFKHLSKKTKNKKPRDLSDSTMNNGVLKNQILVIGIFVPEAHQGEYSKR